MAEGSAVAGFAAVVLGGGSARRMGGSDKPSIVVAGRSMRDRVLDALAAADPRVVVGGSADVPAGVRYTREDPPGGGPVAAIAAGLAAMPTAPPGEAPTDASKGAPAPPDASRDGGVPVDAPRVAAAPTDASEVGAAPTDASEVAAVPTDALLVAVVAGDLPLLTAEAIAFLRTHMSNADGALFVDRTGRRQLLCGVWRAESLRRRLAEMASARADGLRGASVRALVEPLNVVEVAWVDDGPPPWFDCDTDDDLRRVRAWLTAKTAG